MTDAADRVRAWLDARHAAHRYVLAPLGLADSIGPTLPVADVRAVLDQLDEATAELEVIRQAVVENLIPSTLDDEESTVDGVHRLGARATTPVPAIAVESAPDAGRRFHLLVSSQDSYAVGDGPQVHDDPRGVPWRLTVRAWSLAEALRRAAALPMTAWQPVPPAVYERLAPFDDPRFDVVQRLPRPTQVLIFGPFPPVGQRDKSLVEVAHRAGEAGLTNRQIFDLLDALCDRWGKYPDGHYDGYPRCARLMGLVRMVRKHRGPPPTTPA